MRHFKVGDLVIDLSAAERTRYDELVHQLLGPVVITDEAGYENFYVERRD